jgi:hypothetical protein
LDRQGSHRRFLLQESLYARAGSKGYSRGALVRGCPDRKQPIPQADRSSTILLLSTMRAAGLC